MVEGQTPQKRRAFKPKVHRIAPARRRDRGRGHGYGVVLFYRRQAGLVELVLRRFDAGGVSQ